MRITVAIAVVAITGFTFTLWAAPADESVSLAVPGRTNATPWITASGPFVAVAWGATAAGKTDVFVAVSHDGARTFGAPVQVNTIAGEARLGGEMPPRIALLPSSTEDPEISVLWTARGEATEIKLARSHDGGRHFDAPIALQSSGAAGDRGWPALAVDSRGRAHAIWLDHRGFAASREAGARQTMHHSDTAHDGIAMAQKSGLYYDSAANAPAGEREITNSVCYCCKTALAIGSDGAIYSAWRHVYPGNLRDIAFSVSRDAGRSFSPPARVSEDQWEISGCPDDGPAMAIDGNGTIHIVWPTVIGGSTPEGALFYATSRDGRTFSPRVRIATLGSPKPSHPQIVIGNGRMAVAWDETVNGTRTAIVRELKTSGDEKIVFGDPVTLGTSAQTMYPVLAATNTGFAAVWTVGSGESSTIGVRAIRLP